MKRFGYSVFILFSFLFFPWQAILCFLLAGMFLFESYYEGVFFAAIIDVLYAGSINSGFGMLFLQFKATIITTLVFLLVSNLKTRLRMY